MSIFIILARHKWKEITRSKVFDKNLALSLVMGFFIIYMMLNLIFVGLFLDKILLEMYPDNDPVFLLNGFLLYYFFIEMIMRFVLQDIPVLSVKPYFHLNISRNSLFHFILLRSIGGLFNFIPLIVFIPFALKTFPVYYGDGVIYQWLAALFLIMLSLNYFIFYVKKNITSKPWTIFLFIAFLAAMILTDKYNIIDIQGISSSIFNSFTENIYFVLIPLLTVVVFYYLNYRYLKSKIYPEEMKLTRNEKSIFSGEINYLRKFDLLGSLIILEIKMLLRHKRTRGLLFMAPLFVLYGLFFYNNEDYNNFMGMFLFIGVMISGMFVLSYGQFMSGWEGGHFDRLLSMKISPYNYYLAKLWLFWVICIFMYILSIPYYLYSWKIVFINLMALFFNLGISPLIIFLFSLYNYKKIDMSGGAAFNWQGMSGKQFIMMLPIMILPMIIYLPFSIAGIPDYGFVAVGVAGLLSLLFIKNWLGIFQRAFEKKKYTIASGFREN